MKSILVKPAGPDCNLDCAYCFYLDRSVNGSTHPKHRINEEVLEALIKQVLSTGEPNVSFGWQGGEPTLMGVPFFEKAVEFQIRHGRGQSVGNGLQTNGILLDKTWAQFLNRYHFLVGLSIDGPRHVHDHYRVFRGGRGSWSKVADKAKLLLDHQVEVNAVGVVNDYSVRFPEEIYRFNKELGLTYMQFIPCVETDPADPTRSAPFSVSAVDYGKFLITLFDLWINDFKGSLATTSIRFFDSVFHQYVGMEPPECTLLADCGVYVVVEHNGDVFSCDFFVQPEWKLGNVLQSHLSTMLNSPLQNAFGRMKSDLPLKCRQCRWLFHCRGGCPKDRIRDKRDQGINHFCLAYQMFFEHADAALKKMAEDWKTKYMHSPDSGRTG